MKEQIMYAFTSILVIPLQALLVVVKPFLGTYCSCKSSVGRVRAVHKVGGEDSVRACGGNEKRHSKIPKSSEDSVRFHP